MILPNLLREILQFTSKCIQLLRELGAFVVGGLYFLSSYKYSAIKNTLGETYKLLLFAEKFDLLFQSFPLLGITGRLPFLTQALDLLVAFLEVLKVALVGGVVRLKLFLFGFVELDNALWSTWVRRLL